MSHKAVVYKIFCKDDNIKEFYIGSSKNLYNRLTTHKADCKKNKNDFYKFINNNGGWDNWDCKIIIEVDVLNQNELKKYELEQILLLKPSLNKQQPFNGNMKEYRQSERWKQLSREWHRTDKAKQKRKEYNKTRRDHINKVYNEYKKNNPGKFKEYSKRYSVKVKCDCGCEISKAKMKKHLETAKHKKLMNNLISQ